MQLKLLIYQKYKNVLIKDDTKIFYSINTKNHN